MCLLESHVEGEWYWEVEGRNMGGQSVRPKWKEMKENKNNTYAGAITFFYNSYCSHSSKSQMIFMLFLIDEGKSLKKKFIVQQSHALQEHYCQAAISNSEDLWSSPFPTLPCCLCVIQRLMGVEERRENNRNWQGLLEGHLVLSKDTWED